MSTIEAINVNLQTLIASFGEFNEDMITGTKVELFYGVD